MKELAVNVAVIPGNKILLVNERVDGKWAMPDVWADLGESPSEMSAPTTP